MGARIRGGIREPVRSLASARAYIVTLPQWCRTLLCVLCEFTQICSQSKHITRTNNKMKFSTSVILATVVASASAFVPARKLPALVHMLFWYGLRIHP